MWSVDAGLIVSSRPVLAAFALSLLVLMPIGAISRPPAGDGTKIAGRVTGPDNKPIAGAQVVLSETTRYRSLTTITDDEGRFVFNQAPAGLYTVVASQGGYVSRGFGQTEPAGSTPLRLEPRAELLGVDLRLEKGGVITGKITGDSGEPVVLAGIEITDLEGRLVQLRDPGSTKFVTDDRGVYRLFGLPAGRYLVRVDLSKMTSRTREYASYYYPGVQSARQAAPVDVSLGSEAKDIDFAIKRRDGGSGTVVGRVTQVDGSPLPQATVWVYTDEATAMRANTALREGSFEFKNLPVGDYTIEVIAQDPRFVQRTRTRVFVRASGMTETSITVEEGSTLSGWFEMEDGSPPKLSSLLHVTAFAENAGSLIPGGNVIRDRFKIVRLPSGILQLAAHTDSTSYYVAKMFHNQQELPEGRLSIGAGAQLQGVRIILSDQGGSLQGNVRSGKADGLAPGGWVSIVPIQPERREIVGLARNARVDHRGFYSIEGIAPGRYFVMAYRDPKSLPSHSAALDSWAAERRYKMPVVEFKARDQQRLEVRTVD